ncbi:MAG: hypothetical protein RL398_385, partial [Planctomycetota bacterium]
MESTRKDPETVAVPPMATAPKKRK